MRLAVLAGLFFTFVLTANLMAVKTIDVWCFTLPAAVWVYPFSFTFNDLVTEFYGFKAARKIVLLTFLLNAAAMGFLALAVFLPPSRHFGHDAAFRVIFLGGPRILGASFAAFVTSGLLNSFLFDRIKRATRLPLVLRSAASTFCGVLVDSAAFILLAFWGKLPRDVLLLAVTGQILAKLLLGVGVGAPVTWRVATLLRRGEK